MTTMKPEPAVELPAVPTRGDQLPDFTAPAPDGALVRTRDFYLRRNLVLVFTHAADCATCRDLLGALARQHAAARAEAGEIVAVVPGDLRDIRQLRDELALPFVILADEDGAIHQRYGLIDRSGEPLTAIFVADRYGTIFHATANADHRLLPAEEIPGWLEFIACQCS